MVGGNSTAAPSSSTTFLFSTSERASIHDYSLDVYERTFLIIFELICTVLTILLNGYLIFTIVFKLKISKNCVFIPMLTAAALGLFHGFGCNLMMTISLIHGDWVGSINWCGAAANIHKYIVYSIIYIQVFVSLEAAYLISHPHGYSRFSRKAKISATLATVIAVFLNFPITICQFFFLKPSNIIEFSDNYKYTYDELKKINRYFYFDEDLIICYRFFFPKTLDYHVIVYFIHTCNLLAVALTILSYGVIIRTVLKLRGNQKTPSSKSLDHQHQRRSERQVKQNKRIALMSLLTTTCVLTPWLLSMVVSLLLDIIDYQDWVDTLGIDGATTLLRANQYMYYIVTWIFPIMTIMANSALSRAAKEMLTNLTTFDFELPSMANMSVARFNVKQQGHESPNSVHL